MSSSLTDLNLQAHQFLGERYTVFLEQLTALDEPAARDAFAELRGSLERHRLFEDQRVLPCLQAGQDITAEELARVTGDHQVIGNTLELLEDLVEAIFCSTQPRRELVANLSRLGRLQGILEHHTERETRFVYPVLDQMPDREFINLLAEGLLDTSH